jgi:hypothetical protein
LSSWNTPIWSSSPRSFFSIAADFGQAVVMSTSTSTLPERSAAVNCVISQPLFSPSTWRRRSVHTQSRAIQRSIRDSAFSKRTLSSSGSEKADWPCSFRISISPRVGSPVGRSPWRTALSFDTSSNFASICSIHL